MIDFIAQTKLPGVLIAKAVMSKFNFDTFVHKDTELQKKLKDIGYLVKLNPATSQQLTSELTIESKKMQIMKQAADKKAEVFSRILTGTFEKIAISSKFDTETINSIAQILFIWDEFIDFAQYQKTGDVKSIKESPFYRAATDIMQQMSESDLQRLDKLDLDTFLFEDALNKLKVRNGEVRYTNEHAYEVIGLLEQTGLTKPEAVFFLLVIESSLFIKIGEKLLTTLTNDQAQEWKKVASVQIGIEKAKSQLHIFEDELEQMLDRESETLVLKLDKSIFN